MTGVILPNHFSGNSRIYDATPNGLTALLRGISENVAQIAASSVAPLTNDIVLANPVTAVTAPVAPQAVSLGNSDCTALADVVAAFGTAEQALADIVAQTNLIVAKVPAFAPLTNLVGVTPATTVANVTQTFKGASAALVTAAGFNTLVSSFNQAFHAAQYFVSKLLVATGQPSIAGSALASTRNADFSGVFVAPAAPVYLATGNGDAVHATDASAVLAVVAGNLSLLVAGLNAVVSVSPANFVANTVAA